MAVKLFCVVVPSIGMSRNLLFEIMIEDILEELLTKVPFFDRVEAQAIKDQLRSVSIKEIEKGEKLIQEGELNRQLYIVLAGTLKVVLENNDNDVINTIKEGESVGEISLFDGQPATASVIAETPCRLLILTEDKLWPLVYSSHRVCLNLVSILANRMRQSTSKLYESQEKTKEMESKAITDGLTGVFNRMWLDSMMPQIMTRLKLDNKSFSVLMIDVDHFKKFNDTYGHKAGDDVLITVAKVMKEALRASDILARYGGEEFTVLLQNSDLHEAIAVGNKLRNAVSNAELVSNGKPLPSVTISLGVAQMSKTQTPAMLLGEGDAALYRAKAAGRNRVSE